MLPCKAIYLDWRAKKLVWWSKKIGLCRLVNCRNIWWASKGGLVLKNREISRLLIADSERGVAAHFTRAVRRVVR